MKILLLEDDVMIGSAVQAALMREGFAVDWAQRLSDALVMAPDHGYVLAVLDLGLPDGDGLSLVRRLRARQDETPLLLMTARDALADRVVGLDQGADDYLVKPFEVDELLARVRALVRRRQGGSKQRAGAGDVQLDLATRELLLRGERVALTAREYALLHALLDRPGAVLSRSELEECIYAWGEEVSSNAIDTLIYTLRKKLPDELILNVRGLGWRIAPAWLQTGAATP